MPRDLSGSDIYRLSKRIDNYPGEGTFNLAALRVRAHQIRDIPHVFYESVSTYDILLRVVQRNMILRSAHVPAWYSADIQIAVRLFESVYSAPLGILQMPLVSEYEHGEHALGMFLSASDDGNLLYFANSWGADWGNGGRGAISREYIGRYMTDAWLTRSAPVGPRRFSYMQVAQISSLNVQMHPQYIPTLQAVRSFRMSGYVYHTCIYKTVSLSTTGEVSVIEIRNDNGLRLAWAYLFHSVDSTNRTSILKEFYVWPRFRRKGFGTRLEETTVDVAREYNATSLQFLFHHMDARPHVREAGQEFAVQRGYEVRWGASNLPTIWAIGEKYIV